ncbi:MAG: bifunctional diaminohydroxyphosphoribosylaminopyrimidine deaminase/5-amino-6-(5-phosphoribosylamino)uracil reductase RibD [Paracoccaceae bacterium]|nr:bifunctional diaminohydroxyphosphoribosylaminopyrimidine deaminase/5-amino-6-(5-phosphoribosylamino)uracil reductase RibD [Paracoccaceae bacterium]
MQVPSADLRWMRTAIRLGERNIGQVWPGPAVGCVLVRDGRLVGRGWTGRGGKPHAEAAALRQAGDRARGATAYVSLEPCAHHGRTPPCAHALIAAGVSRVVTPIVDPDTRVSDRGHRELEAAGIDVTTGVLRQEAIDAHVGFLSRITRKRPHVTLKLAATLDGRIATATGESRWITGSPARRRSHWLRARHDAILVGRRTVESDDPSLDVRLDGLEDRSPVRVIFDSRLRASTVSTLARTAGKTPLWICHTAQAPPEVKTCWRDIGARTLEVPASATGTVDPGAALANLAKQGLTLVLCEGGGALAASLLRAGLVDCILLFSAGAAVGEEGKPAIGQMGLERLPEAPRFRLSGHVEIAGDLMSRWVPDEADPLDPSVALAAQHRASSPD